MRSSRWPRPAAITLAIGLAAALVASCDAPSVAPDLPELSGSPLPGDSFYYRWETGRTIAVYADPTAAPAGYDLAAATRTAAGRWNALARYGQFELATTARATDADVVIRFRFAPPIVDLLGCEPAGSGAGRTTFCTDTSPARVLPFIATGGGRVKVEVYVDPEGVSDEQLAAAGLTRQEYFVTLVTHELGHVLGIGDHSSDPRDIMNGFPRVRVPSASDAATLDWVWLQEPDLVL